MADYAGAVASIRDRLETLWTTTRITYQNEAPADPWPPVDGDGRLVPFVNLEVVNLSAEMRGAGTPGQQVWVYDGFIYVHVFVPINTGTALATQYAVQIGEMFRGKTFYADEPGCCVKTWAPRVSGGDIGSDDRNWFEVTMSVPFEYWHRG